MVPRAGLELARGFHPRILSPERESAESLGNVRKRNHLAGFSAKLKAEVLGSIRKLSGKHLGDTPGVLLIGIPWVRTSRGAARTLRLVFPKQKAG